MAISHPPQLNGLQLTHSTTMRFVTNAAVAQTAISFANLLDTYLNATTTTAGVQTFQAVKIRRLRMWACPVIGGATTVQAEFAGLTAGVVGDQIVHTDTSMGVQPAHIDVRPSARCLAADFQLSSAAIAFLLTCPSGTVVDLEVTFHGHFNTGNAVANALVGATAGGFYLRGLDGLATAATVFAPAAAATFLQ